MTNIENHFVTLGMGRMLQRLGWIDCSSYWTKRTGKYWRLFGNRRNTTFSRSEPEDYVAPMLTEILELLPESIEYGSSYPYLMISKEHDIWYVDYAIGGEAHDGLSCQDESVCDAAAKMLIRLVKGGIIQSPFTKT